MNGNAEPKSSEDVSVAPKDCLKQSAKANKDPSILPAEDCKNTVKEFEDQYQKTFQIYEKLASDVEDRCKEILASREPKGILSQISSRTKSLKSARDKAQRLVLEDPSAMEQFRRKMRDLAGVRILTYFPDDVAKVVQEINRDSSPLKVRGMALSYSGKRKDGRENEKSSVQNGNDPNYTYGPWIEESVSTTHDIRRWKHYGYKAVHLYVELKEPGNPQGDERTQDISSYGAYSRDKPLDMGPSSAVDAGFVDLKSLDIKVAEIQITTVVMHAWSQVEHDVIYKNPFNIPDNPTITRMLDGINGLSITSEIMLEELDRTIDKTLHTEEAPFETAHELGRWLEETYLSEQNEDRWKVDSRWTEHLFGILRGPWFSIQNRRLVRQTIEEHKILGTPRRKTEKADLCGLILRALSLGDITKKNHKFLWNGNEFLWLYKLLLLANSLSIMIALGESDAHELLLKKFDTEEDIDKLNRINGIILGFENVNEIPDENKNDLTTFSEKFLADSWCNIHDIAVAFTHFSYFSKFERSRNLDSSRYAQLERPDKGLHWKIQPIAFDILCSFNQGEVAWRPLYKSKLDVRTYELKDVFVSRVTRLSFNDRFRRYIGDPRILRRIIGQFEYCTDAKILFYLQYLVEKEPYQYNTPPCKGLGLWNGL